MKKKIIKHNINQSILNNIIYQPKITEQLIYQYWEKNDFFKTHIKKNKENYSIVIPPPNITGNLHMGHALQHTIMDILIRYQRMQGKNTLWQGGTDHAGIATQLLVENKISYEENKTRYDYGRKNFIKKILAWKTTAITNIYNQMKRLGNSINWKNERFTMDNKFSKAVQTAFITLYNNKLIYRGKRLVNWDFKLRTAISDLEVKKYKINSYIWYIKYPLKNNKINSDNTTHIIIATTRPETIFGDTAIAIHPHDSRYNQLIGQYVKIPIINRLIPIISDEYVDINKGTGCLKITPGHDFNDYQIAKRHKLPIINIFSENGNINKHLNIFDFQGQYCNKFSSNIPKEFQEIDRLIARNKIINKLEELNFLVSKQSYKVTKLISDRTNNTIEPLLTDQWYINMKKLSQDAIMAVKTGRINFFPSQYKNLYFSWMQNIEDWCISRQLWWGHRIPAWYDQYGNIYVDYNENSIRSKNHLDSNIHLTQDENVLDTWFSSALWSFASLGWPDNHKTLHNFHPTNILVTGFDIIFFWVARMIMLTMYLLKDEHGNSQIPFKMVYVTGLICDEKGKKMSKSKGNIIDPIDIIDGISLEELIAKRTSNMIQPKLADEIKNNTKKKYPNGIQAYGADALRFALTELSSTERNIIHLDIKQVINYRNFCNKLWNASRYVIINIKKYDFNNYEKTKHKFSNIDKWIITSLNQTIKSYRYALDHYKFDIAANVLYKFTWHQFCDWYIELTKQTIYKNIKNNTITTCYVLTYILENIIKLAHPIIPFITENIWQQIKYLQHCNTYYSIMYQPFPSFIAKNHYKKSYDDIEWIKELIVAIRNIRAETNILPNVLLELIIKTTKNKIKRRIIENKSIIEYIAKLNSIVFFNKKTILPLNNITKYIKDAELYIIFINKIDKEQEVIRIDKEINKITKKILLIQKKLNNIQFLNLAPNHIIKQQQQYLTENIKIKEKLMNKKIFLNK
uniref:Valine--tRNA ligase n=1 Tax=Candidatus Aschnera chinzeii TaxID=1485666 RepID=A0AAT9G4C5_9ENTR|nr:MAG: valine--tRNA ligase [Candidatus Aschnera chinzeii]